MKRIAIITFFVFCLLLGSGTATAYARKDHIYIVQPGDTLIRIAARHDVSVSQLAHANGLRWNSWVYVGQRLVIPGDVTGSAQSSNAGTYVVQPGDTLIGVAARNGVSVSQLARANGLRWNSWIYFGRQLVIPGQTDDLVIPSPSQSTGDGKRIQVNLTTQTLTAYQGDTPVYNAVVSTGLPNTPTPVGEFSIWVKFLYDDMQGPGYYLPDVPYTMYFYGGYGLHGTYWHDNFGTPMSHGCVNLSTSDAEWLYNWASVGTKVVTHY